MRNEWDALRSVARYVSVALGPDWEVRFDDESISFPYARVDVIGGALYAGRAAIYDVTLPLALALYPDPAANVNAEQGLQAAMRAMDPLTLAFRRGTGKGRPMRIPLYNYDGLALDQAATEANRQSFDFLRVSDFAAQPLPDPQDRRRVAVNATLRVHWRRVGYDPSTDGPTATIPVPPVHDPDLPPSPVVPPQPSGNDYDGLLILPPRE